MSNEKVLMVEDEERISRIVTSYLQREGFVVSVAPTGREALQLMKKGYDLIILDLMLPDMEGETLCSTVRESSDVPIIMLTAKGTEDERVRGLGLGADDYVVKPFSPRELVARVKAHLRRSQKKEDQVLSFNRGVLKSAFLPWKLQRRIPLSSSQKPNSEYFFILLSDLILSSIVPNS